MDNYEDGYKNGFDDGYKNGFAAASKIVYKEETVYVNSICPKCRMDLKLITGYVCGSPHCPSFPQVTCGITTFSGR